MFVQSYGKTYGSPSSIFGSASSPSSSTSTSSSPTNFTLPENLPTMGWPPGAFHRFRWCYVNEGNFCKADATQIVPAGTSQCCAWCQLAMP